MYTPAVHRLHWLVLGGTKVWHLCLISSAVKIFPNLRAGEAVVGMGYGFVVWAGEKVAGPNGALLEVAAGLEGGERLYTAMT